MADVNSALLEKALSYLSRREYHRAELKSKLLRTSGYAEEHVVETVLNRLEASALLSDTRFIESFIASRQARLYGPVRIRMELLHKKLDPECIDQALAAVQVNWQHNARRCWQKKFSHPPTNSRELAQQRRFLWQRGYSEEMIRGAIQLDSDEEC